MNKTLDFIDELSPKLLMFCGKGGVGKTTMATATAFHFAEKGKRTLLISTDPSPSISDILETNVLGRIVKIDPVANLDATELDYETILELWKRKFGEEVYDVVSCFLPVDREIIDYISKAPGIDYEFALSYIYDIYKAGIYDIIIWDTAPAGGTLSLIALQEKFYEHLGEAAKLYLKVKNGLNIVKGKRLKDPLKLIKEWKSLSKNVLSLLKDSNSKAIIVTIPEGLGVKQTYRIVDDFNDYNIDIIGIVMNYIINDDSNSELLMKRKNLQESYIQEIQKFYENKMPITLIPLFSYEIKCIENISRLEHEIFVSSEKRC